MKSNIYSIEQKGCREERRRNVKQRIYLAIDLKSFYASVECRDRGLDPMDALLVVADRSRTEKNHLPGSFPRAETLWDSGQAQAF